MARKSRADEIKELQEKVFGKNAPKRTFMVDSNEMLQQARNTEKQLEEMEVVDQKLNEQLQANLVELERMTNSLTTEIDLDKLKKEIEKDFGVSVDYEDTSSLQTKSLVFFTDEVAQKVITEVNKNVIGQEDFVRKLVLSFRRPYVMDNGNPTKNTMLVMGSKGTGKHFALHEVVNHLFEQQVLKRNGVSTLDLGLYTTQEDEKLLLQDLFTALRSEDEVVVFENVEYCYPAYLVMISDLLTKGVLPLKKRYVMNNNQLMDTNNALMQQTISELTANDKYLVFLTGLKKSKVIDLLGAEVVKSFGDIVETKAFAHEDVVALVDKAIVELVDASHQLNIKVTVDESVKTYFLEHYLANQGFYSLKHMQEECLAMMSQYQLEHAFNGVLEVTLRRNTEWEMVLGEQVVSYSSCVQQDSLEMESIKKELDEIVGLDDVKEYVLSLEDHFKVQKIREQRGLKTSEVAKHMIFTGNPGTGKTTIARIISKYLRAIGVLSGGQLVEVTRADLVGRYVGHTAPLTMQVIKSALGGVLFIDEAYALYRGKDDNFGLECIDTLVKGMEDYRDDVIVILAGYKKEMEVFLTSNSGLKSRFPNVIHFKDYTAEELLLIAKSIAKSKEYTILPECDEPLLAYFDKVQKDDSKISGNGRLARNKVEEAILQQSRRVVKEVDANLDELCLKDFVLDDSSFVE